MLANRVLLSNESPTLKLTTKIKNLKAIGKKIIELNIGEPDLPTPDFIKNAAKNAIDNNYTKYTINAGITDLRKAISEKLKHENNMDYLPDEIVVSTGAKQAIYNAIMALVNPGDEVIIPAPYYVSYPEIVKLAGGIPIFITGNKSNGLKPDIKSLINNISDKTKLIILCNPNNPTGAVLEKTILEQIADIVLSKGIFVLVDEIYEKLVYDNINFISFASIDKKLKDYTITVNGFSKSYCMTGWRLGYVASNKQIINAINILQSHQTGNTSSISQYAALDAFNSSINFTDVLRKEFEERRNILFDLLSSIPNINLVKPEGAFYLFPDISLYFNKSYNNFLIKNSYDFCDFLLEEAGVAVVPGLDFGIDGFIRITYTTSKDEIKKAAYLIETALLKLQ